MTHEHTHGRHSIRVAFFVCADSANGFGIPSRKVWKALLVPPLVALAHVIRLEFCASIAQARTCLLQGVEHALATGLRDVYVGHLLPLSALALTLPITWALALAFGHHAAF